MSPENDEPSLRDDAPLEIPAPGGGVARRCADPKASAGRSFRSAPELEYELPGGARGTATGRIFLRFTKSVRAADRQAELAAIGYRVVDLPTYAPEAAWLTSVSGDAVAALRLCPRLAALHDVAHLEAELLRPRASR